MNQKVSMIIPVYNVEDYLEKCVSSVTNQTYKNLEIILVDDGATDSCPQICDRLAGEDQRIKVMHKENGGLSSARNTGYQAATGDYLMYVDSDDVLKTDIVERCVTEAQQQEADVIIFGYEKTDERGNVLETCQWGCKVFNHDEMVEYLYEGIAKMSFGYAWNKLYKKSVLDESGVLADSEIIDREDLVYNMELLPYFRKVVYLDYAGYEYLQRSTSLLHNSNLARLKGIDYFVHKMKRIGTGNHEVDRKVFNMNVLHYLSDCIIKNVLWNTELSAKEKKQFMRQIIEQCPFKEELYKSKDDAAYIKKLYKTVSTGKVEGFYLYVKLSDWKRNIYRLKDFMMIKMKG